MRYQTFGGNRNWGILDTHDNYKVIFDDLTPEQTRAKARDLNQAEAMRNGRELLDGLTLDAYTISSSGELMYRICDNVGVVNQSIYPHRLDKYFKVGK